MKNCVMLVGVLCVSCGAASGEYKFDLVQDDSTVLARLTLADFSTDPTDIVSLTFSVQGQKLFGYGPIYEGEFDALPHADGFGNFRLEADGIGLTGGSSHVTDIITADDYDPPPTSLPGIQAVQFTITALDVAGALDGVHLGFLDSPTSTGLSFVSGFGTWQLVPEPSGMALSSAVCVLMAFRRRRKI